MRACGILPVVLAACSAHDPPPREPTGKCPGLEAAFAKALADTACTAPADCAVASLPCACGEPIARRALPELTRASDEREAAKCRPVDTGCPSCAPSTATCSAGHCTLVR